MTASKKVVFLIDRGLEPSKGNLICINIHLTCLRILTYFAHASYTLDIKPSVFWGFKFYESRKRNYTHLYKQNPFYEFSINKFQEFEKELYENLHNEFDVLKSRKNVSPNTFPGDCFRDALQEIISDYQWDRPELFSPAKLKDRTFGSKTNYIIVFSYSANIINENSFKNIDLEKRFIDMLLPDTLKSKMGNFGITLCWVDIGSECNTKCSSSLNQLKDHLKKINGVVFDLSTISSLWLGCHGETIYYRDMLSTSSLLNGLLSPDAQKNVDKCCIYSCTLSKGNSLAKPPTLTLFTQATNKLLCPLMDDPAASSLRIVKELNNSDIQLHFISSLVKPCFFVLHSDQGGSDMKKLILEKKVLKVSLTCDAGEKMAVLIPYTYHAGVFLMLTKKQKEGTPDVNMDQQGIVNQNFQEEDSKLKEIFDECGNRDYGTSLVNIIDPWFASNMKLGFPMQTKKHFKSRNKEDHEIEKTREENSKQIIDFIRSKLKKEKEMVKEELQLKTVERPLVKKRANMKGVTWARWRLMEYQKKKNLEISKREIKNIKEENDLETMADTEMKIDDVSNLKEFNSTSDLSTYCLQECEKLLERVSFSFYESMVMLKTIEKHFDGIPQFSDKNKKEKILEFVDEHILSDTVRSKLEENNMDKIADLYLLQVNIAFAVVKTFCNDEYESEHEALTKKVVSLCRSITFIKNALFMQDYLRKTLLPRYLSSVPNFMRSIYEDLMLDVPDELEKAITTSERAAETSPFKPIQQPSSLLSIYDSDTSSVGSVQNTRRPLRRIPSLFNESSNQKIIAVPFKPKQKTFKKNKETNMPTTPSSKRRRRKAETPRKKVPNTPEAKQVNDMIWKKQERERRHSFVDKKMKPIEESPLKDIMSPTKSRPSLYRSKSFQTFTSPRSFYTMQRRPSFCIKKFDGKPEHRAGYLKSERNNAATIHSKENEEPHEINKDRSFLSQNFESIIKKKPLQRRKSSLLLNFEESEPQENAKNENKSANSHEYEKEPESIEYESKRVTRRNIFSDKSHTSSLISRGTSSSISSNASSGSLKRKHSSTNLHVKKFKFSVDNNDEFKNISGEFEFKLFGKDLKNKRDEEINFVGAVSDRCQNQNSNTNENRHESGEHSQRIDAIKQGKIKNTNENTVDWLNLIEKEQAGYENEEPVIMASFSKHGDKPFEEEVKSSPTIVKAGDDSISVSPCILLSSLQTLEKAPILSPSYHMKDTSSSRQRRKKSATEYKE